MTATDATELKNRVGLSTGKFLLLTLATAGFYSYYWLLTNNAVISEVTRKHVVSSSYMLTLIGLLGWGSYFGGVAGESVPVAVLSLLLMLSGVVMSVIWSFRAKDALRSYAATFGIDYKMNSFYTLVLQYLYISYCINELPEEQSRLRMFVQHAAAPANPV